MAASCSERSVSTTSLQPLYLLNSPHAVHRSGEYSRHVHSIAGNDRDRQIVVAFELALGRSPTAGEMDRAREFMTAFDNRGKPELVTRALSLWLRADRGVGGEESRHPGHGGRVAVWRDQLVGDNKIANDLTQRSELRKPLLISEPAQGLQGHPMVRFGRVPDKPFGSVLFANRTEELEFQQAFTMFIVLRFAKDAGPDTPHETILALEREGDPQNKKAAYSVGRFHSKKDKDGKTDPKHARLALRLTGAQDDNFSQRGMTTNIVSGNSPVILAVRYGGQNVELDLLQNGRVCLDQVPWFDRIAEGASRFNLGGYDALEEAFEGDLGEVLIYRDRLTDQEKNTVLSVLQHRWKLGFAPQNSLLALCQAILNLNEFLYIE